MSTALYIEHHRFYKLLKSRAHSMLQKQECTWKSYFKAVWKCTQGSLSSWTLTRNWRVEQSGNCPFCLSIPRAGMGTAELPLEWSWWVEKAPACSALLCFLTFAVERGTLQIIHGSSVLPREADASYSHVREFGHAMNSTESLEE